MKCQGRPDGPCPNNKNDVTVHNTIGDLFLCDDCEEFRWPSVQASAKGKVPTRTLRLNGKTEKPGKAKKVTSTGNNYKARSASTSAKSATVTNDLVSDAADCMSVENLDALPQLAMSDTEGDVFCIDCHEIVTSDELRLQCNICHNYHHQQCSGLPVAVFSVLSDVAAASGWVCRLCRDKYTGLKIELARVHEELADLRTSVAWLFEEVRELKEHSDATSMNAVQNSVQTVTTDQPSRNVANGVNGVNSNNSNSNNASLTSISQLRHEVRQTVQETMRRKCNVVVIGLPEVPGGSLITEGDSFLRFCEENLSIKPALDHKGCKRLGTPNDQRPRRLLVHLRSESSASDVISAARTLRRNESTKHIYINPDLTKEESKLAFEHRQRRRAARSTTTTSSSSSGLNVNSAEYHPACHILINAADNSTMQQNAIGATVVAASSLPMATVASDNPDSRASASQSQSQNTLPASSSSTAATVFTDTVPSWTSSFTQCTMTTSASTTSTVNCEDTINPFL